MIQVTVKKDEYVAINPQTGRDHYGFSRYVEIVGFDVDKDTVSVIHVTNIKECDRLIQMLQYAKQEL